MDLFVEIIMQQIWKLACMASEFCHLSLPLLVDTGSDVRHRRKDDSLYVGAIKHIQHFKGGEVISDCIAKP